jgi:peptidyl-prolyl cis-trans isomerase A (cyclophilin A)
MSVVALAALTLASSVVAQTATQPSSGGDTTKPKFDYVLMQTSKGEIVIELNREKAHMTVANFLAYVDKKHYDGTVFHRIMSNFMIQGGGFTADGTQKPTDKPIKLESQNGLHNERGTIAMARTNVPNSATSQFFINVVDNRSSLDATGPNTGYAVFGKVVAGMTVVDAIKAVPVDPDPNSPRGERSKPRETVTIVKASRLTTDEAKKRIDAEKPKTPPPS